jgi:DNA-binding NarL/FixJ family response regulator
MKLLLVDDHPLFGIGFSHALTQAQAGITVHTALTLEAGLALAGRTADLDVVLIDYRLGSLDGVDGLEGLRRFGAQYPLVARVLISGDETSALAARAQAAGAAAFLGKSLSIAAILHALDAICRGGEYFGVAGQPVGAYVAGPTARQLEVLALVAQGQQNKQIAHALGIAERTVKLHLTTLFDALDARNRTHLLVRARESGLL